MRGLDAFVKSLWKGDGQKLECGDPDPSTSSRDPQKPSEICFYLRCRGTIVDSTRTTYPLFILSRGKNQIFCSTRVGQVIWDALLRPRPLLPRQRFAMTQSVLASGLTSTQASSLGEKRLYSSRSHSSRHGFVAYTHQRCITMELVFFNRILCLGNSASISANVVQLYDSNDFTIGIAVRVRVSKT